MDKQPNILIKEALQQAVQEINNGITPTEALKKAAEYYDLNHNFIQRTGEALNTALHYHHFKTASDKAAEFPLADINKVVNDLYNENEKTANHQKSDFFPSNELFNPIPDLDKIFNRPQYKEAYLKITNAPKDVKPSLSYKAVLEKSSNYIRDLEKQVTNAQIKESEATLNIDAAFFNLANTFKKDAGYRTSFEEFESQAFSKFGEKSLPYLDLMYKHSELKEDRGVHDSGYIMFEECPELKKFSKFFEYVDQVDEIKKEASDALENLTFEKQYISEIYKSAEDLKKKNNELVVEPAVEKEAGMMDIFKHVQEQLKNDQRKSPGTHVNHDLDKFEQQAILQDIILTDPILKHENPHKVIEAYEQIARLAPDLSREKPVVVSLIRQLLSGQALAPHASNMLVENNINMLKLKGLQQGSPQQHNK